MTFNNINILNKEGRLTKEDRKEPLEHRSGNLTFTSCLDLSIGVKITGIFGVQYSAEPLASACVSFGAWWRSKSSKTR